MAVNIWTYSTYRHPWDYFYTDQYSRNHIATSLVQSQKISIGYAAMIQADDLLTEDVDVGLYDGSVDDRYFLWVTGRPQYDGATVIPTGENKDEHNAALNVWREGILCLPGQISPTIRMIDLTKTGDYGSLSGFNFAIHNGDAVGDESISFAKYIEDNDIYLINRKVKFFVIMDNVFTEVWEGRVSETKYDETTFKFICEDTYKQIHKALPPEEITVTDFPKALDDSQSNPVPICFGDINKAKIINVTGNPQTMDLGYSPNREVEGFRGANVVATGGIEYLTPASDTPTLEIYTPNTRFTEDYFAVNSKYFLYIVYGTEQTIRIIGNDLTTNPNTDSATTVIKLSAPLLDTTEADFNANKIYIIGNNANSSAWQFQILNIDASFVVSTESITEYPVNSSNEYELTHYNKDQSEYKNTSELVQDIDSTDGNNLNRPFVRLMAGRIDESRNISLFTRIPLNVVGGYTIKGATVEYLTDAELLLLSDRDRTSYVSRSKNQDDYVAFLFRTQFPIDKLKGDYDKIWCLLDFRFETSPARPARIAVKITPLDNFGVKLEPLATEGNYPTDGSSYVSGNNYNFIPNEFYVAGGDDNSEVSFFNELEDSNQVNEEFLVDSDITDRINKGLAVDYLQMSGHIDFSTNTDYTVKIKEIALMGLKVIDLFETDFYIKLKGEQISGVDTNNVYRAFQHILETYDGIDSADIDYNTMADRRGNWDIGRQITDKKQSQVYLKELAQQSFVGIYPTRQGKRGLKAWRDDTTIIKTFSDTNGEIIEDTIKKYEKTSIASLYNDFKINYDWDPGRSKFNKSLTITNTDDPGDAGFPAPFVSTGVDTTDTFDRVQTVVQFDVVANLIVVFNVQPDPGWNVGEYISLDGSTDGFGDQIYFREILAKGIEGPDTVYLIDKTGLDYTITIQGTTGTLYNHTNGVPKWTQYVGGIDDYGDASDFWEICNESYKRANQINKLPSNLSNCFWYPDPSHFAPGTGQGSSTARKYLENLLEWTTRQKELVEFMIPLEPANLTLELCDPIYFNDSKFTHGDNRIGWITKIKIEPARDRMIIGAILDPVDIIEYPIGDCTIITETGTADTVTESGTQPDTITEGAC